MDGARRTIAGRYVLTGRREVGFHLDAYDRSRPLVIDPALAYSTYVGSSMSSGAGIAVDPAGNAYIVGTTNSAAFPTSGGIQPANHGGRDAFVAKLNTAGSGLVYSTYLGGAKDDIGYAIAVDANGAAYVTGTTFSVDFPVRNAAQQNYGGNSVLAQAGDVFVTKIDPTGSSLVYSTYLGGAGDDAAFAIATDSAGSAYLTGATSSSNFPAAGGISQTLKGSTDAFVAKLNAAGGIVYSTYLGGGDTDQGLGIAVDSSGSAYVAGLTSSLDFPTVSPMQPKCAASGGTFNQVCNDAFVAKLSAAGNALVYSTYLGGHLVDKAQAIAVDAAGNAYVAGATSSNDFPATPGVLQHGFNGGPEDAFVAKLNPAGSALIYATYLGGSGDDIANGIAVDTAGNAYVAGFTGSKDFPTVAPIQPICLDALCNDVFVAQLNSSGTALLYSTFLGGADFDRALAITVDASGVAYITGETQSPNFPTTPGAYQASLVGTGLGVKDAFVTKIVPALNPVPVLTQLSPSNAAPGGAGLSLSVKGSSFIATSVVLWNGSPRATTFVSSGELTATILAADLLNPGSATVTVFNPVPGGGTSGALQFPIILPPAFTAGGLVNAASFSSQSVTPGAIVALFGTNLASSAATASVTPLPTALGGVSVMLNGIAAPLFFVSPLQINFEVPWELQGKSTASLSVQNGSVAGTPQTVTLAAFNPGLFSTNSQGTGQGAILLANTSFLAAPAGAFPGSQPAARGSYVEIFASGLGAVTNTPATGAVSASSPLSTTIQPTVTIGNADAPVSFSGLAPGFVGLYQVNVQVPAAAPVGGAVPVVLTIGGAGSNTVTMAVQ